MKRRDEIDGLRAFAVVPVVLFHAGAPGFGGGYLGVDLFFVISGFLIAGLIADEMAAGAFSLAGFYQRRARRILPLLLLVLFACAPFAWAWAPTGALRNFLGAFAAAAGFMSNFNAAGSTSYFEAVGQQRPLLHTWSLAVEEQFYLIFPLGMVSMRKMSAGARGASLAAIGALSLALAASSGDHRAFYWPQDRAFELLAGAVAALAPRQTFESGRFADVAAMIGAGLIAIGYAAAGADAGFPSLPAIALVSGTGVLLRTARDQTWIARALRPRPFVAIGLVSYGAYLWHQPLFAFAQMRSVSAIPPWGLAALIALTFGLATLTYFCVERPTRDPQKTATRPLMASLAGLTALAVVVGLALQAAPTSALPFRLATFAEIDARLAPNFGFAEPCDQPGPYRRLEDCASGSAPSVLVWGDSYAMHLVDGLRAANPRLTFAQATRSSCAPLRQFAALDAKTSLAKAGECVAFNEAVLADLAERPEIEWVVLSSSFEHGLGANERALDRAALADGGEDKVEGALLRLKSAVERLGKRVLLVSPPPADGSNLGDCLARAYVFKGEPDACDFAKASADRHGAAQLAMLRAAQAKGLEVRWLSNDLCQGPTCRAWPDGALIYRDSGHLSHEGSRWIGEHGASLILDPDRAR